MRRGSVVLRAVGGGSHDRFEVGVDAAAVRVVECDDGEVNPSAVNVVLAPAGHGELGPPAGAAVPAAGPPAGAAVLPASFGGVSHVGAEGAASSCATARLRKSGDVAAPRIGVAARAALPA